MKPKLMITILLFLFSGLQVQAQLLEKLKERAKEKGLETREVSFDSSDNATNRTTTFEEEKLTLNALSNFRIDASRLETKGLGESVPVSDNTSPEGKANNRHVEFIKI